jgi:hypothetical protein
MVDERTIRAHILALRALLNAAQERCEAILTDIRERRIESRGAHQEIESLCRSIDEMVRQVHALQDQLNDDA